MKRRNKLANDRPSRRHWRPRRFFFVSFFSFGVVIDMMVLFILRNNPSNSLIDRWINLSIAFSSILNEKCWLFHWSSRYCWRIWVSFVDLFCHNVSIHRRLGWWRHLRRNAIGWVTPADSATANQNRRVERNGHRRLSTGIVIAGFQNRRKTIEFHQMSLQTRLISVVSAVFLRYLGVST